VRLLGGGGFCEDVGFGRKSRYLTTRAAGRAAGVNVATLRLEATVTLKDKLEIGLKEDAPFRKDNLPDDQVRGPEIPAGPGRSPEIPLARGDKNIVPEADDPDDVEPSENEDQPDR